MADPLSLGASLLTVASAGVAISKTLFKLADTIGSSTDEIRSIGKEVSAFARVVEDLHEFLEDAKDLISQQAIENALDIMSTCGETFAKIKRKLKFRAGKHVNNFWQGVQWSFRREKVKPLCAKLESYKTTLIMMISVMKLARCKEVMVNDSKANVRKERRYRANLEDDIVNTSVAISHWQQEEITAEVMNRGRVQLDPVQLIEIQWLAALVPYEASDFYLGLKQQSLTPFTNISGGPAEQEHARLDKAVDLLLTGWTTLFQPTEPRIMDITSQASRSTRSHPTSMAAIQKDSNTNNKSPRSSKAEVDLTRPKRSETTGHIRQDPGEAKSLRASRKKSKSDLSKSDWMSSQPMPKDPADAKPAHASDGTPVQEQSNDPKGSLGSTHSDALLSPELLLLDLSEPTETKQEIRNGAQVQLSEVAGTDTPKRHTESSADKNRPNNVSRVTFHKLSGRQDFQISLDFPVESRIAAPEHSTKSILDQDSTSDTGVGNLVSEVVSKPKHERRKPKSRKALPPSPVSAESTWPPFNPDPAPHPPPPPLLTYPGSSPYCPAQPHFAPHLPFIQPNPSSSGTNLSQNSVHTRDPQSRYFQSSIGPTSHMYQPPYHPPMSVPTGSPVFIPHPSTIPVFQPSKLFSLVHEGQFPASPDDKLDESSPSRPATLAEDLEDTAALKLSEGSPKGPKDLVNVNTHDEKHVATTGITTTIAATTKTLPPPARKTGIMELKESSLNVKGRPSEVSTHEADSATVVVEGGKDAAIQKSSKEEKIERKVYINLKNPAGKTFKFPFRLCTTWEDIQARVRDVFDNASPAVEGAKSHIQSGHYDLCDESGAIFLPKMWKSMIGDYETTGLTIRIEPWPLPETNAQDVDVTSSTQVPGPEAQAIQITPNNQVPETQTQVAGSSFRARIPETQVQAVQITSSTQVPNIRTQTFAIRPTAGLPNSEEGQSVCTEMDQSDVEEEEWSAKSRVERESSTESRGDPADPFIDDNLHWRYNFLYQFDEHDEKFQKIWETEMKKSQAKAENAMLEILLGESNAKLKEFDVPFRKKNDETQLSTSPPVPGASASSPTSDYRKSPIEDEDDDDATHPAQDEDRISVLSSENPSCRTTSRPHPKPIITNGNAQSSQEQQTHQPEYKIQAVKPESSFKALEDANKRAGDAVAKAEYLERRLHRLERIGAHHTSQTPPDTPSLLSSPFSVPLPLVASPGQALRPPSVKREDSVRTRSITSLGKRIFGRHKSSSGATS